MADVLCRSQAARQLPADIEHDRCLKATFKSVIHLHCVFSCHGIRLGDHGEQTRITCRCAPPRTHADPRAPPCVVLGYVNGVLWSVGNGLTTGTLIYYWRRSWGRKGRRWES